MAARVSALPSFSLPVLACLLALSTVKPSQQHLLSHDDGDDPWNHSTIVTRNGVSPFFGVGLSL